MPSRWLAALALGFALADAGASAATLDIVPEPQSVTSEPGAAVRIARSTPILVPSSDSRALATARWLAQLSERSRGLRLVAGGRRSPRAAAIELVKTAGPVSSQAYRLTVGDNRVRIEASSETGLLYGAVTLWQMLTAKAGRAGVMLPPVRIDDAPRFAWRGVLIDSARHMQTPAYIMRTIDWMALHKLDVLQWHLTDDQGWRLPVPGYPRLASVGAWRTPAHLPGAAPRPYGGVYSQADIRRIVAHAQSRGVTIVPEIEMPGHALSALLAYPELSAGPLPPRSMQSDWGLIPDAFGVDPAVFTFLDRVMNEVMDLFPGRFIAVGGDEVPLDIWRASPAVQARMKALGINNEAALQNAFFRRIDATLAARGRRMIGWEEMLQGGPLPADAAIASWQGAASALAAASAGHDVVLAVAPTLYFDNRQSALASEPPGRGWIVSLADVYAFDPGAPPAPPTTPPPGAKPPPPPTSLLAPSPSGTPIRFTPAEAAHVLGVQGNVWTEHIATDARLTKMLWPRAAAVAEMGWTDQDRRSWSDFLSRLPGEFRRFASIGLEEDRSSLAVSASAAPVPDGGARVVLANQTGLGAIRYALGGGAPNASAAAYARPFQVKLPLQLRAAAFMQGAMVSPVLDMRIDGDSLNDRVSQDLQLCPGTLPLNLEGQPDAAGVRPVFLIEIMNPCWIWKNADLAGPRVAHLTLAAAPFNLQLGPQLSQVAHRPSAFPGGEIEARLGDCDAGELLAESPLPKPTARVELALELPARGADQTICFVIAHGAQLDPIWGLVDASLRPAPAHG